MQFHKQWQHWCCVVFFILISSQGSYASVTKINLAMTHANLPDAIRLFAQFLKLNVVVSPQVMGDVTLQLHDAEPTAAFRLLLLSEGLAEWQVGNVSFIAPRDELLKRKEADTKWQNLLTDSEPLVTFTRQIRYARADDIARLLQDEHSSMVTKRGSVRLDRRTNTLYIEDIPARVNRVRAFIQQLDIPVKQIQIKARLASVDTDVENMLGVHFGVSAPGITTVVSGQYSMAVAHLPDSSTLDVKLSALESKGRAQLISSPQLFTANLQTATIEAGEEVPYQEVSESGGTAVVFKKAVLGLKVTPQVLPGNKVLLTLEMSQDRPSRQLILGMPTISTRQIRTTVLINAGQTIVLGGIYEDNHESGEQRIPFLGDLPLLGHLFRDQIAVVNKRELLIFITPTISIDSV